MYNHVVLLLNGDMYVDMLVILVGRWLILAAWNEIAILRSVYNVYNWSHSRKWALIVFIKNKTMNSFIFLHMHNTRNDCYSFTFIYIMRCYVCRLLTSIYHRRWDLLFSLSICLTFTMYSAFQYCASKIHFIYHIIYLVSC